MKGEVAEDPLLLDSEFSVDQGTSVESARPRSMCSNCGVSLSSSNSNTFSSAVPAVHSILSEMFSLQIGQISGDEFRCCRTCSVLVSNAQNWFQSFKKRMTSNSKLYLIFDAIDKHMKKFSVKDFQSSTFYSSSRNYSKEKIPSVFPAIAQVSSPFDDVVMLDSESQDSIFDDLPSLAASTCNQSSFVIIRSNGSKSDANNSVEDIPSETFWDEEENEGKKDSHPTADDVTKAITSVWKKIHRLKNKDPSNKGIECYLPYCNEVFVGVPEIVPWTFECHMEKYHNTIICCDFCAERLYGKDENAARVLLERHLKEKHDKEEVIPGSDGVAAFPLGSKISAAICSKCSKRFYGPDQNVQRSKLRVHMKSQHRTSVQCEYCSAVFEGDPLSATGRMKKHVSLHHHYDSQVKCRICEKPQENNKVRKQHEFSHLSKIEREEAARLDPTLKNSSLCPHCGQVLSSFFTTAEKMLERHILNMHPNLEQKIKKENREKRIFSCDKCDYTALCNKTLRRHKEIHNENGYNKYTCERCGKGYKVRKDYVDHTLVCCDEKTRPACCTEPNCLKRFKYKQNVVLHLMGVHRKTAEEARAGVYPGLPVHNWLRKYDKKCNQTE